MTDELVNMSSQFQGLPMADLIGAPLSAACDSQIKLAQATADFINVVGFLPDGTKEGGIGDTRTSKFKFKRPVDDPNRPGVTEEEVEIEVPLLSIVKVPNLAIDTVDISFDMEVKSSFSQHEKSSKEGAFSASAAAKFGMFSANVNVSGAVATHKENTRSSDNSAKYHVAIHAQDKGMPEGLARVMDILQTACAPRVVSGPSATPAPDALIEL